jgi:DMSO/TMAO reductase YedYZ molybdopterin-dependent catalytic subunit
MRPRKPILTRRNFLKLAGTSAALASLPLTETLAAHQQPLKRFGGPTPNADFYLTSYSSTPIVDAGKWALRIGGLVNKPFTLSYDSIQRRPSVTQTLTLECISNPPDGSAISTARWTGVRLKPLLDEAGVKPGAVYAVMRAADGYYTGVPVAEIMREENWMPYLMNGVPLPPDHGYPLRIFIPGKYGMKQPKWITEIEFVDREFTGYWEARGWSNEAWRKVNSGFFYPRPSGGILDILSLNSSAKVSAPIDIYGWALAGPSGIKRVQVSLDNAATWHEAQIVSNESPYIWTVWKYRLAPSKAGDFVIRVRATDGVGVVQPESDPQTGSGMSGQPRMKLEVMTVA